MSCVLSLCHAKRSATHSRNIPIAATIHGCPPASQFPRFSVRVIRIRTPKRLAVKTGPQVLLGDGRHERAHQCILVALPQQPKHSLQFLWVAAFLLDFLTGASIGALASVSPRLET